MAVGTVPVITAVTGLFSTGVPAKLCFVEIKTAYRHDDSSLSVVRYRQIADLIVVYRPQIRRASMSAIKDMKNPADPAGVNTDITYLVKVSASAQPYG